RAISVDVQADAGFAFAAVAAPPTRDVERSGHEVSHVQKLHIAALLDDLAGNLVAQDHTRGSRRPAANHMLVAPADVRAHQLQDHAMFAFARPQRQFGKLDRPNFDFSRSYVYNSTIVCHFALSPIQNVRMPWRRLPPLCDPALRSRR